MRLAHLAAFALWLIVALLAVAGFAAFSPETAPTPTTSTTVAMPVSAGADWGSTSGRVVALAFSSGLYSAPGLSDLPAEDALISDLLGERPEVTTTIIPEDRPAESAASPTPPTTVPDGTSAAATTPQSGGGRLSEAEVRGIIALFFAPQDVDLAAEVAYCESRWDPGATNPASGAAGLFQQIPRYWSERSAAAGWEGASIHDAHANAAVSAWLVYDGGGWIHWAASQGCWG